MGFYEQFKVAGNDLAAKVRELIHEGNVRRIIIKDERGHTFMEIPLTIAAVGVILAPVLAVSVNPIQNQMPRERPRTSFMISSVPPPIGPSRASRAARSMSYSTM